jgi:hypothetical protein
LAAAPRSGLRLRDEADEQERYTKVVVIKLRRWAYRITYTIRPRAIEVIFIDPSWKRR